MTEAVTEMPRSRSTFIQSERARLCSPRAFTAPAIWIAPPNSSSFSVKVVLPASGCAMIAKVRRRATAFSRFVGMCLDNPKSRRECRDFCRDFQGIQRRRLAAETLGNRILAPDGIEEDRHFGPRPEVVNPLCPHGVGDK